MTVLAPSDVPETSDLVKFTAVPADVAAKDQMDLMSRCCFRWGKRSEPIFHEFYDARTGRTETIHVTGTPEHGIATMHDQDLLIFIMSQMVELKRQKKEPARRISFTPYQFFAWVGREPTGSAYKWIKEALRRLATTSIETTIRSERAGSRSKTRQFSWVSEWKMEEEGGVTQGVEVVLAEWLFESIQNLHVLTIDKRYFELSGAMERWLYLLAIKATGGETGIWREGFESLYGKSASEQDFNHFKSDLRKTIKKNGLPGLKLQEAKSAKGQPILLMERGERSSPGIGEKKPVDGTAEQVWRNAQTRLVKRLGVPTYNSWFKEIILVGVNEGVLSLGAPSMFVADWVSANFRRQILEAWRSEEFNVSTVNVSFLKVA